MEQHPIEQPGNPRRQPMPPLVIASIVIGGSCALVVLIGIVATVAIPMLLVPRGNAEQASIRNSFAEIAAAEAACYVECGYYADLPELAAAGYLDQDYNANPVEIEGGITIGLELAEDKQGFVAWGCGLQSSLMMDQYGVISEQPTAVE